MIINGDSLEVLKTFEDNSIDSVVTDPPYGLSFMGKKWDYDVPSTELWVEVFRVLKPGGHLLAFAGTRTQHRMAVNIEDAGFEIRDMIAWVYGSGFPKSLNISKAIDKQAGASRKRIKVPEAAKDSVDYGKYNGEIDDNNPITPKALEWNGWGTALKPALEPITVARKPIKGTVANNVLEHGVGGLNIDGCRVETPDMEELEKARCNFEKNQTHKHTNTGQNFLASKELKATHGVGRFPANFIHDGSDEVVGLFPNTNPSKKAHRGKGSDGSNGIYGVYGGESTIRGHNDNGGSASRFFYCTKASKSERNKGLEGFEDVLGGSLEGGNDKRKGDRPQLQPTKNFHPTVKPVKLMQYLVRLVTPKGGTVLDPFNGSGTTGIACKLEGMEYIGIELDPEYCKISEARIEAWEADKQEKLI